MTLLEKAFELKIGPDAVAVLPNVTRDVLVHTWDLAQAVGADDRLDPRWCEHFYVALPSGARGAQRIRDVRGPGPDRRSVRRTIETACPVGP